MLLVQEYDVLEKPLNQKFDKCKGTGSTLYITRVDVIVFIAVRLANKKAIVRCDETGKTIRKKYWNEETHQEAKKLLTQHKTPKLGYIIFILIFLGVIGGIAYGIISEINSSNAYENSFIAKSEEEQSALLNKLGEGDLLLIYNNIYRIKSIDDKKVVLEKSNVKLEQEKISPFIPIDESLVPLNSYEGSYEIKKEDFIANNFDIDNKGASISQYLDK